MKATTGRSERQGKSGTPAADGLRLLREAVKARLRGGVLEVIEELFEEQRRELIGEDWSRKEPGQARSGGSERGSVFVEGRRIPVVYPRVRDAGGSRALPAYQAIRNYDLMAEEVQAKLVRGVATRDYADVSAQIAGGTGLPKSTVSRAFVRASQKSLDAINGRSLSEQQFVGLFIDGLGFGEVLVVAAMGVTVEGKKVVLGLVEGHTENATVVAGLLDNLVDRGLSLTERFLATIDGSKALKAALVRRWGDRAILQRCQEHKKRNVTEHLPPRWQAEARRRMAVAYGLTDAAEAESLLRKTVEHLRQVSEDAARSLEEGLEETLTVVRLRLPAALRRTFATTNPIESAFASLRYRTGRVKRWRSGKGQMVLRWTAAAALETEKRFKRIKGYKLLGVLLDALKRDSVDAMKEVG